MCASRLFQVMRGTRYVIGMWFTCHEAHRYVDEDDGTPSITEEHQGRPSEQKVTQQRTARMGAQAGFESQPSVGVEGRFERRGARSSDTLLEDYSFGPDGKFSFNEKHDGSHGR